MSVLDANGRPFDPVQRAMRDMEQSLSEAMFGQSPDQRLYELRQSVLGDDAGPKPGALRGLAAWLPREAP